MPRPRPRSHPRRRNTPPPLPFSRKLVLHRWLLGLFGVERFDRLAGHLWEESLEGLDEGNVLHFHRVAFQEEDQGSYIGAILRGIGSGRVVRSGR